MIHAPFCNRETDADGKHPGPCGNDRLPIKVDIPKEKWEQANGDRPWEVADVRTYVAQMDEHVADLVNHPPHYSDGPKHSKCGETIECIDVARTHGFSRGNAIKYLWRAGKKDDVVQDLRKAIWYIQDEIATLEAKEATP